jgi:hypothetical protein
MRPDLGPEFIIASEAEAASGAENVPLNGVDGVAVNPQSGFGLGAEELAHLHSLLLGQVCDDKVLHNYEQVYVWDEMHGPWLIQLPDDFVFGLANYDPNSLQELAKAWSDTCYAFRANEAPQSWLESTLRQLTKLARRTVQQNKKMYWQAPSC